MGNRRSDDEQHPQKWKGMHMASVYTPLSVWFSACGRETVSLDFSEVERILGRKLPPSARRHDVWWRNEDEPTSTHSQSKYGWMPAGYIVSSVDRNFLCVTFTRS